MGACESIQTKAEEIGSLSDDIYRIFIDKCCCVSDNTSCRLNSLANAFGLFLLSQEKTRDTIAPFFEEPRNGRYNFLVWSHYAKVILQKTLKTNGFVCVGTGSEAFVLGLSLSHWPNPIQSADGFNIILK